MSVMIDKDTKVIVQGITGKAAMFHTQQMLAYGTKIVAGVTPGKAGQEVHGVPVFNTVADAVKATGATASVIYVPARFAADSILEAVDAELDLVVCITEHIPVLDMVKVRRYMQGKKTRLVGPNCPGLLTSRQSKLGITPGTVSKPGHVGLISRSGTLTYEAAFQLTNAGIGQTTTVGIGGDPVKGTDFIDALQLFKDDPDTYAVLIIGEIGGTAEEDAAKWIRENMPNKPVSAFIAGRQAPPGKRMGHAGAIVSGSAGGTGVTTYAENIGVMAATRVYSTAAYIVAACFALVLSMLPKFGALIATIPPGVLGGAGTVLYGMIGMLGVRIWVQNRVDFSNPVNLNTAAVALIVAIANFTWVVGDMTFGGIALGTAAALLIYHGMRLISKLRGTNLEAATPASAPSGSELEGEAYSKRHRSPAPRADA